ncbi:transmembrane signal receptor [Lithospermum erythrorhizon]|uniref:Transmembrane signal receptor n=1 Tax=Lithospermum erythrorhizon TaxID=34254 RepID=A0AAV3PNC0_LITER
MDEERLYDFLYGINTELFCHTRSTLVAQDLPPSLDRAYQTMLNQERLNSKSTIDHVRDDIMAMSIHTSNRGNSSVDSRPRAPPKASAGRGLLRTPSNGVAAGHGGRGPGSGPVLHSVSGPDAASVHPIQGGGTGSSRGQVADRDNATASKRISELTDTQWNNLLQILGNSETSSIDRLNGKFSVAPWIIDSGASTHVTDKTEVLRYFTQFLAMVDHQFNAKVKIVRSDNGTQFFCLREFFLQNGIVFQTSCVRTPQQNGRVEYKNRHILNVGRALRFQWNLPIIFWVECILTTAFLTNRTPSNVLNYRSPLPVWEKGWKLYDLATREFFVSRDVVFYETEFPYINDPCVGSPNPTISNVPDSVVDFELADGDDTDDQGTTPVSPTSVTDEQGTTLVSPMVLLDGGGLDPPSSASALGADPPTTRLVGPSGNCTTSGDCELGRGHITKTPSVRLPDFVTNTVEIVSPSSSSASPLPIRSSGSEPKNFKEAMDDPGWRETMHREIRALEDNGTWRMETFVLVEGIDYGGTFAPVAKIVSVRTFLAVAAAKNWEMHQMDVHNAFLHSDLTEEVYMKVPPGFSCGRPDELSGWCDSDWASCPLTRLSISGWVVFLGDSLVSWKSKKQITVARSSVEAEYRSTATVTCELKWFKGLLHSLGISHSHPIHLHCDSQSALHIAQNPVFHERTKHIKVDCHFLRDAILDGLIATSHVSTSEQLEDIFTKALRKRQFEYLLHKLGIHNLHAPT